MTGTIGVCDISVISGTLICIADQKRNWSTGSLSFKNSGKDLHQIAFLTGSCITALTGLSPVKKNLDIFFTERKTCGTAVENGTDGLAVRFSPGGNHEFFSE